MAFVLDASVTAAWAFEDEDHPDANLAFRRMRTERRGGAFLTQPYKAEDEPGGSLYSELKFTCY